MILPQQHYIQNIVHVNEMFTHAIAGWYQVVTDFLTVVAFYRIRWINIEKWDTFSPTFSRMHYIVSKRFVMECSKIPNRKYSRRCYDCYALYENCIHRISLGYNCHLTTEWCKWKLKTTTSKLMYKNFITTQRTASLDRRMYSSGPECEVIDAAKHHLLFLFDDYPLSIHLTLFEVEAKCVDTKIWKYKSAPLCQQPEVEYCLNDTFRWSLMPWTYIWI